MSALDTENIGEWSNMTRPLCVELQDIGDGLERDVQLTLVFLPDGNSTSCKNECTLN